MNLLTIVLLRILVLWKFSGIIGTVTVEFLNPERGITDNF